MTDDEIKALMAQTQTEGYPNDVRRLAHAVQAAERERWVSACRGIANDLRNHDVVRMTAAKCIDAGLRVRAPAPAPERDACLRVTK